MGTSSSLTFIFHFSFVEEFFHLEVMSLSSSMVLVVWKIVVVFHLQVMIN